MSAYPGNFSPELAAIAEPFFDGGWIDAPVTPGKSPGAFAHPTVPSVHPYLLAQLHGQAARRDDARPRARPWRAPGSRRPAGHADVLTPLTLAETASVFGEMLTFREMLDQTRTSASAALLAQKVEDMINTVVRQIAFYDFERRSTPPAEKGELTADDINAIWISVQTESLGPAIRFSEGYETFWAYIPHFIHSPFYVYAYAFGDCLVNSLYAVYRRPNGLRGEYLACSRLAVPSTIRNCSRRSASMPPIRSGTGASMIEGLIDELEALDRQA